MFDDTGASELDGDVCITMSIIRKRLSDEVDSSLVCSTACGCSELRLDAKDGTFVESVGKVM